MDTQIVYYRTNEGTKTALVVPSQKLLHIIMISGHGLVHVTAPKSEERYMEPINMSLKQGIMRFGGVARRKGSTKQARTWLTKARKAVETET